MPRAIAGQAVEQEKQHGELELVDSMDAEEDF